MAWDKDLLPDQKTAAMHVGNHARLLAGPGTGKTLTLTRRICFLVKEKNVPAESILALTFTRAAAQELRQRVANELGNDQNPHISTLHSFALRQLITNRTKITDLPQPLRIADDWEERKIILEDLKALLGLNRISKARDLLNHLSADWQSLTEDEEDWEKRLLDPRFLGTWREHRKIYGYTLRAELVYQLKKALEQRGDFQLEGSIKHLFVDEYQDLNRCDLAVVKNIASRGVELFVAGDDDQSIYGFRKAHPEGIRRFSCDYSGTTELELEICKRCDRNILELGLFVVKQDHRRKNKRLRTEDSAKEGEVALLRFNDQDSEATGIANLCAHLMDQYQYDPNDILILLRSDNKGAFSRPIRKELEKANIPVSDTDTTNPLDESKGRAFFAFLRLAASIEDSLAWRSLLQVWCNGVGSGAIKAVYELARSRGENFAQTVIAARSDSGILPSKHRSRLFNAISDVLKKLNVLFPEDSRGDYETCDDLMKVIRSATKSIIADDNERKAILLKAEGFRATSIKTLVQAIGVANEDIEQEREKDKVNILTMHRAKGLTAEAVIIAAAEDQYIPGRAQDGGEIDDERRLFYVSLTRAKHHLFLTYCDRRTGQQSHTGRDSGTPIRSLSQFLKDCPHTPQDGREFLRRLKEKA